MWMSQGFGHMARRLSRASCKEVSPGFMVSLEAEQHGYDGHSVLDP